VVLVQAHAVETKRVRKLELVEVAVVELVALLGIVEVVLADDSGRVMCGREIVRQVRPGHQMERKHAHTTVPSPSGRGLG
jgi:hypothetical protein